jgi:hypothetical protein
VAALPAASVAIARTLSFTISTERVPVRIGALERHLDRCVRPTS